MIIDSISRMHLYKNIIPGYEDIQDFLNKADRLGEGKYEINSGFVHIQNDTSKHYNETYFEIHEKYIDVQVMLAGSEVLFWNTKDKLFCEKDYDVENDIEFSSGEGNAIKVEENIFYILFPDDPHKPCCHINDTMRYKKCVFKLKVK